MDMLDVLPYEVACDVLACGVLDATDLARLTRVSKRYRLLIRDEAIWRALARRASLLPSPDTASHATHNENDDDDGEDDMVSLANAIAARPPLIRPPHQQSITSWRTFVTLHHLSAAAFGMALDGSSIPTSTHTPQSAPRSTTLAGVLTCAPVVDDTLEIAHFRHMQPGLVVATGVQGGLVVQPEDGDWTQHPLWSLPPRDVPPNSRIEVGDGVIVVLPPLSDGPTHIQVFHPCASRRGHLLRCPTLYTELSVAHAVVRGTTLVTIDSSGSRAHLFDLSDPNASGAFSTLTGLTDERETVLDLGHCRLLSVTSLDLDVQGGWLCISGRVEWGAAPRYGVPYLSGSDVLAVHATTGQLLWSLTQGPFPLDPLKRAAVGWDRIRPAAPAVKPEYYLLEFPSASQVGRGAHYTQTMRTGKVVRQQTFQGDTSTGPSPVAPAAAPAGAGGAAPARPGCHRPKHWSFYLRLQYRRAWSNVQLDAHTGTLLASSGATLAFVRGYSAYFSRLAGVSLTPVTPTAPQHQHPEQEQEQEQDEPVVPSVAEGCEGIVHPSVGYIELPEPRAQPYDEYGRAGPYVPSGYGAKVGGWRTAWARTKLVAHDGWAVWDGHAPVLIGYGPSSSSPGRSDSPDGSGHGNDALGMGSVRAALLCADDVGRTTEVEARTVADPRLERAVEQRACTVLVSGAAYRLRPLRSTGTDETERTFRFGLQRWTLAHQARAFLASLTPNHQQAHANDRGAHVPVTFDADVDGDGAHEAYALAHRSPHLLLTNRPHLIHPRRLRAAVPVTLAV